MHVALPNNVGIGIKPISENNTKRLVARAVAYAIENGLASVTLMHKGNIMKFTEGAFCQWGYEVAKERFGNHTLTEAELYDQFNGPGAGRQSCDQRPYCGYAFPAGPVAAG